MRRLLLMLALATVAVTAPRPAAAQLSTEALIDTVQHAAFNYFWSEANPSNGLIRDRSQSGSPSSIAAVGFGLSAITIGIERGWITRDQGIQRVRTTLNTFWTYPQGPDSAGYIGYKGLFYHWLNMNTGLRMWESELSTIDTALLFGGILHCREFFTGTDALETEIRALADSIYRRADWKFMQTPGPRLKMGWKPKTGFSGFGDWVGYNEAMILYILALGSPTHPPTGTQVWNSWTTGYSFQTLYGQSYVVFPPLFGHQYSHCWIDFRNINDAKMTGYGLTYFENSRRATLAQRAYCIMNPLGRVGYSDSTWGLTACDGSAASGGYKARGAPPAQNDDGTIAPTAAISSMPFAPEVCLPAMRNMWNAYRPQIWGAYGFRDAFHLGQGWYDPDFLGIDQGPIVLMLENYRTGSVWSRFMLSPYAQAGLAAAGFVRTAGVDDAIANGVELMPNQPNPFSRGTTLAFRLPAPARVRLGVYDVAGREVARLVDERRAAGVHHVELDGRTLSAGVYFCKLEVAGRLHQRRAILIR